MWYANNIENKVKNYQDHVPALGTEEHHHDRVNRRKELQKIRKMPREMHKTHETSQHCF